MRLMVEVEIPDDVPDAALLDRLDLQPPFDRVEDTALPEFVGTVLASLLRAGKAKVMSYRKSARERGALVENVKGAAR